jgi:putative transcriptional regulator
VNDLANLAELDEQLGRVRWDDEDVGVSLDEDSGFALVGLAEVVSCGDGFGYARFKVGGVCDSKAVGALAAEVGKAVRLGGAEAVDGFGEHEGEGVLAGATGSGKDERVGKAPGANAFAEMGDGLRVAEKVLKAHGLRVKHFDFWRVFLTLLAESEVQVKNRLRVLRAERNWSQADLAERLEVSRQSVNAIETGKYDPSLPLAFKLARLFETTIEGIFSEENPM